MKRTFLICICLAFVSFSFGQEVGKFRLGIDLGGGITSGGGGIYGNAELKYNLKENMNIGLQFSIASLSQDAELDNDNEIESGLFTGHNTYFATYDYYFVLGKKFNPFVGGGLGLTQSATVVIFNGEDLNRDKIDPYTNFGGMIRGGFEAGKFRFTLQYSFIPQNAAQDVDGLKLGKVSNNFFGIAAGFYIGGGVWGK